MSSKNTVDHYEVLEINRSASDATIEHVFRYLAKQNHPGASPNASAEKYSRLVTAFETLRNPEARAAYDKQQQADGENVESTGAAEGDAAVERCRVLSILYTKRASDFKKPGLGIASLEERADLAPELLQFHVWYLTEKAFIGREQSGQISISAAGVDYVESMKVVDAR